MTPDLRSGDVPPVPAAAETSPAVPPKDVGVTRLFLHSLQPIGYNLLSLVVFLIAWEVLHVVANSPFLPGPLQIATAFVHLAENGDTQGTTLLHALLGEPAPRAGGLRDRPVLGVPLGLLMGLYPRFYAGTRSVRRAVPLHPADRLDPAGDHLLLGPDALRVPDLPRRVLPGLHLDRWSASRGSSRIHRKVGVVHGASKF